MVRGTAIANNTPQTFALRASLRRGARWLRDLERRTRPVDPEVLTALARRWEELPPGVQTPAQMLGRKLTGCEGTHGVFPACNFGASRATSRRIPTGSASTALTRSPR